MAAEQVRVLLVDDNPDTLAIYARILSLDGYSVATATSVREALALFESRPFDLVLTDHRMPDQSGLELLAEMRELPTAVPVVLYSAFGSHALESAARSLGAVDFSPLLWDVDELLQIARKHATASNNLARPEWNPCSGGPATRRLVSFVVALSEAKDDVPTVKAWASEFNIGRSTIWRLCDACGIHAADCCDLARGLRVVRVFAGRHPYRWSDALDISDPQTMSRFLLRAGLHNNASVPTVDEYLSKQRFVTDAILLQMVRQAIDP